MPPRRRRDPPASRQIGRVFQALADTTRRAVIERLAEGPASMTELARPFEMALPSFTQHLKVLEQAGVVRSHKEGRVRTYELVPRPLTVAENWMVAQRAVWEQRLDGLEAYVKRMKRKDG